MEHLGRARRGTSGEIAGLQHRGLQTTGCRIQCRAGTYGATTDDDDVVVLIRVAIPHIFKIFGVKGLIALLGH